MLSPSSSFIFLFLCVCVGGGGGGLKLCLVWAFWVFPLYVLKLEKKVIFLRPGKNVSVTVYCVI